jgi:hypothetical protein
MRQEVDIRYVVTSLKGSAQHLYEDVADACSTDFSCNN